MQSKIRNLAVGNLRILETGKRFGNMTSAATFYKMGMTKEKRERVFLDHRKAVSAYYQNEFDPYKFYVPSQNGQGKAITLTQEMILSSEDGWKLDLPADILIVTNQTPKVVVGFPVADCPVIVASDLKQGLTATAHCSAQLIDNYLPKRIIEILQNQYNSRLDQIFIYVGAHAGPNWTYDSFPSWAKKSFWQKTGAIKEEGNGYKIDLMKAILYQLHPQDFVNFVVNEDDTITHPDYYSNSATAHGFLEKKGRNFTGCYYKE